MRPTRPGRGVVSALSPVAIEKDPVDLQLVMRNALAQSAFSDLAAPVVPTRVSLPWWVREPGLRVRMEDGLQAAHLALMGRDEIDDHPLLRTVRRARKRWSVRGYRFVAEGPFGRLRLAILVSARAAEDVVAVCFDGPSGAGVASPHRNGWQGPAGHELCLFYPRDPVARRWVPADGLPALADLARAHVYREYIWRLEGFWPGDEAPHGLEVQAA